VHPETNEAVENVLSYLKKEGEVCFRPEDVESSKRNIIREFDEGIIRSIKVSFENDNEIKIQLPRKKAETPTCRELGFRDNTTTAWKALINILEEPPHIFNLGPAHTYLNGNKERVKDYDRKHSLLSEIDTKLRNFLSRRFEVQVPDNYKLYERCKNEKSGTYKFKFQVVSAHTIKRSIKNKYENLSEDKLIKILTELYEEHRRAPNDANIAKMQGISEVLISKFNYDKAEIIKMLESEKEATRYDPYENVKDKEKDY
jgi:DNA-binding TFAR19-related protein (PDSD5 family)